MFELPEAKRVRREDLQDSGSDDESGNDDVRNDPELRAKLQARLASALSLGSLMSTSASAPAPAPVAKARQTKPSHKDEDEDEDKGSESDENISDKATGDQQADAAEEFEFRLFSSAAPAAKVIVPGDDAVSKDGAMAKRRPISYFIAREPTTEEKANFAYAAVTGDEVLARANQRCWGWEMPWRVVPATFSEGKKSKDGNKLSQTQKSNRSNDAETKPRKRPGKKKRLITRTREREAKKKAEEASLSKMSKEEHLKEKKKRLNRQKKLRRRAKAKETRGEGGEGGDAGSESGSDASE